MFFIDEEVAVWAKMCGVVSAVKERAEPMRMGRALR
jgi:hypothetical protein